MRHRFRRFVLILCFLGTPIATTFAQSHATHAPASPVPARMELAWNASLIAGLPRHDVTIDVHGTPVRCEGVALVDLLRRAGAMPAEPLRGAHLARRVEAIASDGYRVVFSLGELDPTLGKQAVYVADRCNGKPLDAREGPARLLVPGDSRPARSARQIKTFIIE